MTMLTACATVTAEKEQVISVSTEPAGATCTLANDAGNWEIASTPGTAAVQRNFSKLLITCDKAGAGHGQAVLEPKTRNRAYGNILLGGYPAFVDAKTGAAYEYAPDTVTLELK